jgi:hypothetical protein
MAKVLKKYNKETKKWENITETLVNIDNIIYNGEDINDNNVEITNPFYTNDSASTLNDALSCIGSEIAELRRNVSWLAEHGGGGGGGGGTSSTGYGIHITQPTIENNSVYISTDNLIVKFMITGGTEEEICQYRYTYDDNYTSQYVACKVNEIVTIKIDNINMVTTNSTHTLYISAVNSLGTTIPPVSFKIYESSLSLALNKTQNDISNNEVLLSRNDRNGLVYFDIKNGLIGSDTVIKYSCNSVECTLPSYNNVRVNDVIPINVWEVIGNNIEVNQLYTVNISAQSTLGTVFNKTPNLYFNVRITDPNEFTIYFDGLTYLEDVEDTENPSSPTEIEQSDLLKFTFKASLPITITNKIIRYAIEIVSEDGTFSDFLVGNSFSNDIQSIYKQDIGTANTNITAPQYPLNNLVENKRYIIQVKAWTYDGGLNVVRKGSLLVLPSNNEIYPRQHNKRYSNVATNLSADTCLYAWSYTSTRSNGVWNSSEHYVTAKTNDEINVIGHIIPYNINDSDSGFIESADIPYLRLQNEAYAIADVSEQKEEFIWMVSEKSQGFTISITFKCDQYSDTDKVICLFGKNTSDMNLISGIKVSLEVAYWYLTSNGKTYLLKAFIRPNVKNTIDFVYKPTEKITVDINGNEIKVPDGFAYIYVNGIVSAVYNIGVLDSGYEFSDSIYFGCDNYNGTLSKFSDVNIYEFAIYTKALDPLQIVVNRKNAQLIGNVNDEKTILDYQKWKHTNLIYNDETNTKKALSYLINPTTGDFDFKNKSYIELMANTPIPIIRIDANQAKDFTKAYFHTDYSTEKSVTGTTHNCVMQYYDPIVKKEVSFNALIAIQGTSTLGYYIKNLEVIVNEVCTDDPSKTKLFQPKEDWFPEKEFTLKADIVDSSHANNATIGYWINKKMTNIMENNPAMKILNSDVNYRPKDKIKYQGQEKIFTHISTIDNETEIDYDENVTIKHNLEGFPVIVLIKFSDKNDYEFIGIYSFNLGRYSYYNMGLSFLKAFSRREISENPIEVSCPALVDYYEEYARTEPFGGESGIYPNQIFSYEFGANADDNSPEHQTWTQSDVSILKHYGEFNFNGVQIGEEVTEDIWLALSNLFYITATMSGEQMQGWGLEGKYKYTYQNSTFVKTNMRYEITYDNMSSFNDYISVTNAVAYFVIAMAFGMIDSLGKNLTLRTWDGGKKWWTCFYDMDTALGLSNEGAESIPEDTFIDKFENITEEGAETVLRTTYHVKGDGGYNAYYSKLWAILRDTGFLYAYRGSSQNKLYENAWSTLRQIGGAFDTHMNFVNLMSEHIGSCGELIYNYDYNTKYIVNSSNLSMLHGLRIEYVRSWLKNRFYFLDGVLENKVKTPTCLDSPFYSNAFNVTNNGHSDEQTIGYIPYTFKSTAPIFIKINTGVSNEEHKFFLPKNKEVTINTKEHTSAKQTNFTSSSVLTKLEGLNGINVVNMNTNNSPRMNVLPEIVEFNIAGTTSLIDNPIDFQKIFMYKDETSDEPDGKITGPSCLETLNLSMTKVLTEASAYPVNLNSFTKIKHIDISLSNVSSLVLPNSVLHTLKINGSAIEVFSMYNQPLLKTVDFTGCNKLTKIEIVNCEGIETLEIDSMNVLDSFIIQSCKNLKTLKIVNTKSLQNILINDTPCLEEVEISECQNQNLTISLPIDGLNKLYINSINSSKPLTLTYFNENSFKNLKELTISNWLDLPYIIYKKGEELIEFDYYDNDTDNPILDLSKFTSLQPQNLVLKDLLKVKYLRLPELPNVKYFPLYEEAVTSLKNLVRVFGSIDIIGYPFNKNYYFYINKPSDYSEINKDITINEIEYVDPSINPYFTNVRISTNNLQGCFSSTHVTLEDAIYILKQCSNVISLKSAFSSSQIVASYDKPLPKDIFKWCSKVNDIEKIFYQCNITGYLDPDILKPLTLITSFKNVFTSPKGEAYYHYGISYNKPFFPENNNIKDIIGFNPVAVYDEYITDPAAYVDSGIAYFDQDKLLSNLTNLEEIYNSFNNCWIDFSRGNGIELFTNTPNLKSIINSFREIVGKTRDRRGNDVPVNNIFGAEKLEVISSSFSFSDYSEMTISIGDDFLDKIKDTISYIGAGYYDGGNDTYYLQENAEGGGSFLSGTVNKIIDKERCNDGVFPYDILKQCTKLKEVTGLFSGLSGDTNTVYEIPKNMFSNNPELTNISYFFDSMKLNYILTSNSFENNKIVNFSSVFHDSKEYGKKGMLPYHLFYQKKGNIITSLNSALECDYTTGITHYECTKEVFDTYSACTDTNGLITINPYIYDGTVEFYDKYIENTVIKDIYELYNSTVMVIENEVEIVKNLYIDDNGNFILDKIPERIKNVCFEGNNVKYNNLHSVYINAIKDIDFYREMKNKTIRNCYNNDDAYKESSALNYFCPPDILNYCVDNEKTNINSIFKCNRPKATVQVKGLYGYIGRIPEHIFDNMTKLTKLNGIFNGIVNIMPHKNGYIENINNVITYHTGTMYPPNIFSKMLNLTEITNLFGYHNIWGLCVVENSIFNGIAKNITNLSGLFHYANFINYGTGIQLLSNNLFTSLVSLRNIASLFSYSTGLYIDKNMFSPVLNQYISDVSGFMVYASTKEALTVPEFWKWKNIESYSTCYFNVSPKPKNESDIPNTYKYM